MDGMLSQEEINALLGNMNTGSSSTQTSNDAILSDEEKDRRNLQYLYGYGGNNAVLTGKPEGCDHNTGC
mgnify:CR=1 FL=1